MTQTQTTYAYSWTNPRTKVAHDFELNLPESGIAVHADEDIAYHREETGERQAEHWAQELANDPVVGRHTGFTVACEKVGNRWVPVWKALPEA